jgi:cell division septation protein DedD
MRPSRRVSPSLFESLNGVPYMSGKNANEPIGEVVCPTKGCDQMCKVFNFRQRTEGRASAITEYILNEATIWGASGKPKEPENTEKKADSPEPPKPEANPHKAESIPQPKPHPKPEPSPEPKPVNIGFFSDLKTLLG